jgi:cytochrome c oxidase subunit II
VQPRSAQSWTRVAALAAVTLVASGCGRAGAPDGATKQADDITRLWIVLLVIAIVIGALVVGLFAYAAIRWRQRPDDPPRPVPTQTRAHLRLEVLYTVVPLVVVAAIFAYSTVISERAQADPDGADVVVDARAFRWGWSFTYPEEGIEVTGAVPDRPTLVLPVDATVAIDLETADVIHSFWVPGFYTKRDMIPNADNVLVVETTKIGRYRGYCAEYCGVDHARMLFDVEIVEQAAYDRWRREQTGGNP